MKTLRTYAGWSKKSKTYSHFYKSRQIIEVVCGYAPEDVHEVELRKAKDDEETPYWGWEDTENGKWSMIWPTKVQFEMCFAYGLAAAIKSGRGRPVRLIVTRCVVAKEGTRHAPQHR
jgi:hypothetical protein